MTDTLWRVGLTHDFRNGEGRLLFDEAALSILDTAPNLSWELIPEQTAAVTAEQAERYDAIMILGPGVSADAVGTRNLRLRHVARFGVGYEIIDLDACARSGVLVTITPDGVRRPVAMMALTFMLALAQNLIVKDRLTRTGRWDERTRWMGRGLGGRTLGLVGLGNTGRDLLHLVRPFDMEVIAADPMVSAEEAARLGIQLVSLPEVLRRSHFVSLHLPL
jgi:D-3-phosphoglycerate dehydrogenase